MNPRGWREGSERPAPDGAQTRCTICSLQVPLGVPVADYRRRVPFIDNDEVMYPHIAASVEFLRER